MFLESLKCCPSTLIGGSGFWLGGEDGDSERGRGIASSSSSSSAVLVAGAGAKEEEEETKSPVMAAIVLVERGGIRRTQDSNACKVVGHHEIVHLINSVLFCLLAAASVG